MIPMSHLSSVQCVQIKFRPKKKFKIKVSHSVVAAETGEGGGGHGGGREAGHGGGREKRSSRMALISAISLI